MYEPRSVQCHCVALSLLCSNTTKTQASHDYDLDKVRFSSLGLGREMLTGGGGHEVVYWGCFV